jgi:hypothetical protein
MIPRKIYLQYVGDSDEKPSDADDVRDGDVTWSRERVFKHDIVYYRKPRRMSTESANKYGPPFNLK